MSRIASSPISHAVSPASVYASAPAVPAPITASDHPLVRACRRHSSIAADQCSGSPTGLPLARLTEPTTRYDTPARAVAASPDSQTTDLSRRVAKYPSESSDPNSRSSVRTRASSAASSVCVYAGERNSRTVAPTTVAAASRLMTRAHPQRRGRVARVVHLADVAEHVVPHEQGRRARGRARAPKRVTSHDPTTSTTAPPTRNSASARRKLPRTALAPNCRRARSSDDEDRGDQHEADQVDRRAALEQPHDPVELRQHDPPDDEDPPGRPHPAVQRDPDAGQQRRVDEVRDDRQRQHRDDVVLAREVLPPRRDRCRDQHQGAGQEHHRREPVGPPVVEAVAVADRRAAVQRRDDRRVVPGLSWSTTSAMCSPLSVRRPARRASLWNLTATRMIALDPLPGPHPAPERTGGRRVGTVVAMARGGGMLEVELVGADDDAAAPSHRAAPDRPTVARRGRRRRRLSRRSA